MIRRIFLSYRHGETNAYAGWLFQRLESRFGKGSVFMDVSVLKGGEDFAQEIVTQVGFCEVLVPLIGPGWLDARDGHGQRRLLQEDDFVRLEVGTALAQDKLVIPCWSMEPRCHAGRTCPIR